MAIREIIQSAGSPQKTAYEGVIQSPYIACLVNDVKAGMSVLGIGQRTGKMDLDMLSSFFSALGTFSENSSSGPLTGVGFKNSIISRSTGSHLEAWLVADKNGPERLKRDRLKLESLVRTLESNSDLTQKVGGNKGDVRGTKEYTFEVVKRFPFHSIDFSFMDRYCPKTDATIKQMEEKIPYCKGNTHRVFEEIMKEFNGKSVKDLLETLDGKRIDDKIIISDPEVMGVVDSLLQYGFLTFTPKLLGDDRVEIISPLSQEQERTWGQEFPVGKIFDFGEQKQGYKGVLRILLNQGKARIIGE